jgi:hypothetical protein
MVSRLCAYLAGRLDQPASNAFSPENLFAAAFPGAPFDAARLRHVQSYLLDLVRQYLAWSEYESDPTAYDRYLARSLRRRGLDDLFEREWPLALERLEARPQRDARYHYRRYRLHQEQLEQTTRRGRSAAIDLQPLADELTVFYVAEMLRHACSALMHQAVAGQAYRFRLLDAILQAVETEALVRAPAVAVYFQAYQALQPDAGTAAFDRLKIVLTAHAGCFDPAEQRGLYLLAINVCIRRMNAGERPYVREAFELYRAALERDVLTEDGRLSGFTYKNIIRIGAALGEHAWTEQFLENYRPQLHARERDNLYRYNLAFLFFQQQNYARAMPLLRQVEFEDPLNNLDARRMLLRTYFELQEWDALESLLQSFGAYLRRQKNLGYHRRNNQNLLIFTRQLMELSPADLSARASLRNAIESTPDVAERAWLLTQVKE